MLIRCNNKFNQLCDLDDILLSKKNIPDSLRDLLTVNVIQRDGCFYYDFLAPQGPFSKELGDRTGNEAFYNKILIDDYLSEYYEASDGIVYGVLYAERLLNKLSLEILDEKFNVIFSNDGMYSSVTFHRIRAGESWLSDDLEKYQLNSLLMLS